MRVVWLDFHDHNPDWLPDDPWDCEFWVTIDVGDETGSASFQIRVCTHTALARLTDKKHCFLIDEYLGPKSLIERLNRFIVEKTQSVTTDPYRELARIWWWEYGKYNERGHLIG